MTDILAEFFDHFNPDEQAFIRAKQAEAKIILLQGQSDIAQGFRTGSDREWILELQDSAQAQAAATEFVGYQRVLARRIDPVCTESVELYLRQLDRICEGILAKYGRWECKDAIAEVRAEAERLAWISYGEQAGSARTCTTSTATEPEQPQGDVENGKAAVRATPVAQSAEDIVPKAIPTPAVQPGPSAGEAAPVEDEATPEQLATVTAGADGNAIEVTRRADLLAAYKQATNNPSNKRIYEARNSGIHKPQFYEWVNGKLPANSETTRNFERFLEEKKPPIARSPRA
jgi:hypothetical protein